MRFRALAVGVVSLAMLFVTLPAVGAPESACATVTMHAMSSTGMVAPGGTMALGGQFYNCSSRTLRFTYNLSAMSSCGQRVDLASGRKTIDPGMARIWSVSYTMPLTTCSGPWEATMQLNDNGGGTESRTMASTSTTVTVQ
jgi:hypothetical protein